MMILNQVVLIISSKIEQLINFYFGRIYLARIAPPANSERYKWIEVAYIVDEVEVNYESVVMVKPFYLL